MSAGKETRMGTLSLAGKTDVGLVRKNNEDTFISRKIWDGKWCLAAVIDGIGGYEGAPIWKNSSQGIREGSWQKP